jgi:hypothetical protein
MNHIFTRASSCTLFVLAFWCASPSVAIAAGAAPQVDWEQPRATQRTDTGDYEPYVDPRFNSTKSLAATTGWLKSALERYGAVPAGPYDPTSAFEVNNVRFTGCVMQWTERRTIDKGRLIQDDDYTLALGDVGNRPGELQVGPNALTVSLSSSGKPDPLHFVERIQHRDNGAVTSRSEVPRSDNSFVVPLQGRDDSVRRIGTALMHAGRLCRGSAAAR